MNAYILVNEWCNSTESGYDILNVYESKENAIDAMHEAYLNFVEECKEKQVSDFEEYTVENSIDEAIIIRSNIDNNLFEMFYVTEKPVIEETITLHTKCKRCNQSHSLTVNRKKLVDWLMSGGKELVQNVFPEVSKDDRELFFISNICGDCFDELFEE